jgi:glycerol kinase
VTDLTNASRTLLCDIHRGQWDEELLEILDIPAALLPAIVPSSGVCGDAALDDLDGSIPIAGIAGDQQAALFGQLGVEQGITKSTDGTGCFLLMQTGCEPVRSSSQMLTTVACQRQRRISYALEGSIFVAGAAVQ